MNWTFGVGCDEGDEPKKTDELRTDDKPYGSANPIPLNAAQESTIKQWASDDRLWATQETVEFNLRIFARCILKGLMQEYEKQDIEKEHGLLGPKAERLTMTTPTTPPDAADRAADWIWKRWTRDTLAAIIREEHADVATLKADLADMNILLGATWRDSVRRVREAGPVTPEALSNQRLLDLAADVEELVEALEAWVKKCDEIHAHEEYKAVWLLSMVHGQPYHGPNYAVELSKARAVLGKHTVQTTDRITEATKGTP